MPKRNEGADRYEDGEKLTVRFRADDNTHQLIESAEEQKKKKK